jgi:hypothetical protein
MVAMLSDAEKLRLQMLIDAENPIAKWSRYFVQYQKKF